jgi:hypothetical protein
MKKLRLLICSAVMAVPLVFLSCEKSNSIIESSEKNQPELVLQVKSGKVTFDGEMMTFENFKTLSEYQEKINSDESFKSRISSKYGKALAIGRQNDSSFEKKFLFEELTNDYLHSVSTDGMIVIGGELIRFDEEYQYSVPIKDRRLLAVSNEKDINLDLVARDTYGITEVKSGLPSGRTSQIALPGNGSNAYISPSFVVGAGDPGAGQQRRYIHELFGHKGASTGGQTHHRLILRFRMQYLGGGGNWYTAGEPRILNYRVAVAGMFSPGGVPLSSLVPVENIQTTTNAEERVLREVFNTSNSYGTWDVQIRGHISSTMISPNNYFYNYTNGYYDSDIGFAGLIW